MSRYTPGFKGPMTPAAGPRPRTPIATPATTVGMRPPGMGTTGGPKPAPGSSGSPFNANLTRKMKKGGDVKHSDVKMDKKVVKKAVGMHEKQLHAGKKSNLTKLKSGGSIDGCAVRGKTKATMVKMKKGGAC